MFKISEADCIFIINIAVVLFRKFLLFFICGPELII